VHFGDEEYLERYRQYQAHLAEWRAQYPKLASVDMRYERQVVLEMQPGGGCSAG
jgi:cell division protein FtsQ